MGLSSNFESYANKYENINLKRNDGVLEVCFGSNGVYQWHQSSSFELSELFGFIRDNPANSVVIMSGHDEF